MTVLKILAGIAVVSLVWWILSWMQEYSQRKYRYQLFSVGAFSLLVIGWVFFFLAIYVLPEDGTLAQVYSAIVAFTFPEPLSNSIVLVVLASITFVAVLILLVIRTNPLFGLVGWAIQLIGSVLIIPFLILLIPSSKKKGKKQQRYIKVED